MAGGQRSKSKPFCTSQQRHLPAGYSPGLAEQTQLGWCQPHLCWVGAGAGLRVCTSPALRVWAECPFPWEPTGAGGYFLPRSVLVKHSSKHLCGSICEGILLFSLPTFFSEPLQHAAPLGSLADSADSCRQGQLVALIHSLWLFIPCWVLCEARAKHCSCPRGIRSQESSRIQGVH